MKTPKLHCNDCGRTVRDCVESKMAHVMRYHPHVPLFRIANGLFTPVLLTGFFEKIGERLGETVKGMLR